MSHRIYKLTDVSDNFSITVLFLKKISISVNMLMNGLKICFSCIFVYNGVNSPLICHFVNPSCPDPGRGEKINLDCYFHTSLWCLKRFYEGPKGLQSSVKITI